MVAVGGLGLTIHPARSAPECGGSSVTGATPRPPGPAWSHRWRAAHQNQEPSREVAVGPGNSTQAAELSWVAGGLRRAAGAAGACAKHHTHSALSRGLWLLPWDPAVPRVPQSVHDVPVCPRVPTVPTVPQSAHDVPECPRVSMMSQSAPECPQCPECPRVSMMSQCAPECPQCPECPRVSMMSQSAPECPQCPECPRVSMMSQSAPECPQCPECPRVSMMSQSAPECPQCPECPRVSMMSQSVPECPQCPQCPRVSMMSQSAHCAHCALWPGLALGPCRAPWTCAVPLLLMWP
ncbi:protein app1-like [Marmota marmota marmota]|uniref:protein app1-like n=1 Tax=Marmota marmota marmota TaxID=9994 RepID=UPI0020927554|nr:protein app1-like [Marmota marmota marmota]